MKRSGFTLIELVAATAIIGILFGGVSVLRLSQAEYAKKLQFERDAAAIQEAISCYLFFHGSGRESLEELSVEKLFEKGFLIGENKSPWGEPYILSIQETSLTVETESSRKKGR